MIKITITDEVIDWASKETGLKKEASINFIKSLFDYLLVSGCITPVSGSLESTNDSKHLQLTIF